MADGSFDDLLLGMAQRHKGIEDLMYSILSFFERRTDFFHIMETADERMGFMPGVAERMVQKQFRHFQRRYLTRAQPHLLSKLDEQDAQAPASRAAAAAPSVAPAGGAEAGAGGPAPALADQAPPAAAAPAEAASAPSAAAAAAAPPPPDGVEAPPEDGGPGALSEKAQKMMRHISTWNGAATEKYHWSQSIAEVTLEIELDPGTRAKECVVDLTATRLCVKAKGKKFIEGKLHEKINTEDSVWTLDDNKMVLSMEKQRQTWWKCVLEGDEEIDTSKVESTRTMGEYDGETQGAIRKIMFDQTQKAQGKATSDQIRTADVMRDAWNAPGSPFRGTEFDPTMLNLSGPVDDDFFKDVDKRKLEEARARMEGDVPSSSAAGSGDHPDIGDSLD